MANGTGQKHYQREDHAHAAHPPDAALQDAYDAAKKSEADPIGPCCAGRSSGRGALQSPQKGREGPQEKEIATHTNPKRKRGTSPLNENP